MSIEIICGDCLDVLPALPRARMIFADPPDNTGVEYDGFVDRWPSAVAYIQWLTEVANYAIERSDVFWLSYYWKWDFRLKGMLYDWDSGENRDVKSFIWRFTFGQHQQKDCGSGFRPILRFSKPGIAWNTDDIRVPSDRQTKYHDKRADPRGRVPDDSWSFPDAGCYVIELGGSKKGQSFVSTGDAALADLCSWHDDCGYAVGKYCGKKVKLHRIVAERMGLDLTLEVDHIDRNKLNNCRHNLRSATRTEQNRNASLRKDNNSGHTGVSWNKRDARWVARIQNRNLGNFKTKEEAVAARVAAARDVFGEFDSAYKPYDGSDVWDFPRVCGTFKEKRKWHKNQHPEALLKRMILMSTNPGDLVIDMFGGTFTTARVCKELGRDCISIEISPVYCERGHQELLTPPVLEVK